MGPLSNLWVMMENANSEKDDNRPVVKMDTVLELLEKNVELIGQCSNTITYQMRKNALLGVTGTSTTQVAAMLKRKASFLQKHDKAFFGKEEFTDNLAGNIKDKKRHRGNRGNHRGGQTKQQTALSRRSLTEQDGCGGAETVSQQRLQTR